MRTHSTLSNVAYLFAAFVVLLRSSSALDMVYGYSLVALAVASAGYHATLTRRWQSFDEMAMYAALCALLAVLGVPWILAYGVGIALVLSWDRVSSFTVVPALAAACTVALAFHSITGAVAVAVIAVGAFLVRQMGEREGWRTEDVLHSVWHALTAAALAAAFLVRGAQPPYL